MTATIPTQQTDTPAPDLTGLVLAALLSDANQVAAVHGIHAAGDLIVITAATDRDVEALADHMLNGHAVGHSAEGWLSMRDLTHPDLPAATIRLHIRIAKDVLS